MYIDENGEVKEEVKKMMGEKIKVFCDFFDMNVEYGRNRIKINFFVIEEDLFKGDNLINIFSVLDKVNIFCDLDMDILECSFKYVVNDNRVYIEYIGEE